MAVPPAAIAAGAVAPVAITINVGGVPIAAHPGPPLISLAINVPGAQASPAPPVMGIALPKGVMAGPPGFLGVDEVAKAAVVAKESATTSKAFVKTITALAAEAKQTLLDVQAVAKATRSSCNQYVDRAEHSANEALLNTLMSTLSVF